MSALKQSLHFCASVNVNWFTCHITRLTFDILAIITVCEFASLETTHSLNKKARYWCLLSVAILRGAWVGHGPPDFCLAPPLAPPFGPPVFFLILRSFGWHMQGCQMRFVKIPAILSTAPELSCVVIRKQHWENRKTISIVKRQLMICPYFG